MGVNKGIDKKGLSFTYGKKKAENSGSAFKLVSIWSEETRLTYMRKHEALGY